VAERPAVGSVARLDDARRHVKVERRRVLFTIRLTDLEAEMLARAALRAGLSPSKLARARLFSSDVDERIARLEQLIRRALKL
jgi:hypothetical protein